MRRVACVVLLLFLGITSPLRSQARPLAPEPASPAPLPAPALLLPAPAAASGAGQWVLPLGGAVLGGAVGFLIVAPDCLDGAGGCGSRPLQYALVGSLVGAALGWVIGAAVR